MDALLDFALQWQHPDHQAQQVTEAELRTAEDALGVRFPQDYKAEILAAGLVDPTLALSSAIIDREADLQALGTLFLPSEIVEYTPLSHAVGMPPHLIAIASDVMGNSFVYDVNDLSRAEVTTAPVYFWDNDFGTLDQVGTGFPIWISRYTGAWSKGLNYDDF